MKPVSAVTGILIIIVGIVALVTGDFDGVGVWFIALGLGAIGLTGLLSVVRQANAG